MLWYQRRRRRRLFRTVRFFLVLIIGGFVLFFLGTHFLKKDNQVNAELAKSSVLSANAQVSPLPNPSPVDANSLAGVVQKALDGTKGTYAVSIKNLKSGESFNMNEHTVFDSASLYKLWIMGTAYQQIQSGDLAEDLELSEDVSVLNDKFNIDPSDAELTDGTIDFSTASALRQMITISHNYAALLLTEKLKLSNVNAFIQDNNLTESTVGVTGAAPTTTSSDIALFYEKLYKGELANPQYTKEMLDLLKDQQLNEKLPQELPPDTVIAHKTGELDYDSHDAGIVYTPKGDYIIVVMSKTDSPSGAVQRIADLSKGVYDYFQNE